MKRRLMDAAMLVAIVLLFAVGILQWVAARDAADAEACRAGNGANRATRELAATIGGILVVGLEMSEHSAQYASLVEAQVNQAIAEAESHDRDCDGNGSVTEEDYP